MSLAERRTPSEIAFDRAFGLWRGSVDDLQRARRTLEQLEAQELAARQTMLAAREARLKELAA